MMEEMTLQDRRLNIELNEQGEFKRWVFLMFAIFFVVALITRILPRSMRPMASGIKPHESIYDEALRAAHSVVPFLFMR